MQDMALEGPGQVTFPDSLTANTSGVIDRGQGMRAFTTGGAFMRIVDIIHPGRPCRLRHPTVGDVLWTDVPGQGFELVFARGPERGDVLVADESVLLDRGWSVIADGADADDDPAAADTPARGASRPLSNPAEVASRSQLADYIRQLRGNRLDNPRLWEYAAVDFLKALVIAIGAMDGWSADQRFGISADSPSWPLFAWAVWEASSYATGGGERSGAEPGARADRPPDRPPLEP